MGGKRMVALAALALGGRDSRRRVPPSWPGSHGGRPGPRRRRTRRGFVAGVVDAGAPGRLPALRDRRRFSPGSVTNVINHAERRAPRPGFHFDAAAVTPETFAASFDKIDNFVDTADFDLLYLMNLYFGNGDS